MSSLFHNLQNIKGTVFIYLPFFNYKTLLVANSIVLLETDFQNKFTGAGNYIVFSRNKHTRGKSFAICAL